MALKGCSFPPCGQVINQTNPNKQNLLFLKLLWELQSHKMMDRGRGSCILVTGTGNFEKTHRIELLI